jgi:hypothetical protein
VTIGAMDLFASALLKPGAARWRRVLLALRGTPPPEVAAGATVLPRGGPGAVLAAGFRPLAAQAVRLDLVERLARAPMTRARGRRAFIPDPGAGHLHGMQEPTIARLMAELGFRPAKQPGRPGRMGVAGPPAGTRGRAFAGRPVRRTHPLGRRWLTPCGSTVFCGGRDGQDPRRGAGDRGNRSSAHRRPRGGQGGRGGSGRRCPHLCGARPGAGGAGRALPARRGPPAEAQACYQDLSPANVSQQVRPD